MTVNSHAFLKKKRKAFKFMSEILLVSRPHALLSWLSQALPLSEQCDNQGNVDYTSDQIGARQWG